jgi:hypothetical protein
MSIITLHQNTATTPATLVWETPPDLTPTTKYAPIAAALRARPGQWAVIRTIDTEHKKRAWGFAHNLTCGKYADFRPTDAGAFESVSRTTGDTTRVYVRYMPTVTLALIDGEATA